MKDKTDIIPTTEQDKQNLKLMSDRNHTMLYGNIALPYARAIYDIAAEADSFDVWSEELGLVVHVASEPPVRRLLENPLIPRHDIVNFFVKVCQDNISIELKNFLFLLADNNRLQHIVRIAIEFERMKRGRVGSVPFEINTAFPLTESQKNLIASRIYSVFNKKPILTEVIDPLLGAGIVIKGKDNDILIDGSLKKRIKETAKKLKNKKSSKRK
ncbi:MAG: F0F1 ATP synthase subunit delta [Methylacidiphilales bacterium]|nr:F0F1 ATP synthase subunit delta [Candidatus Methylacidiphilales bacterium]